MKIETLEKQLQSRPIRELREGFEHYYGYSPTSRNRSHLIKKILWAAQREEHGDISDTARNKALAIADDRDIKVRFQHKNHSRTSGHAPAEEVIPFQPQAELLPGMVLYRNYQGRDIRALVLENGCFEWEGTSFKSLSAVARAVTGTRWNGRLFFGINKMGGAK